MSEVTLVPYTELLDHELRTHALSTIDAVDTPEGRAHLIGVLLPSVVLRHSVGAEGTFDEALTSSFAGMKDVRKKMAEGNMDAFAVTTSANDLSNMSSYVGTATLQPGLELRKQIFPIRPSLARRLPFAGRPVPNLDTNAVAWVDPRRAEWASETTAAQAQLTGKAVSNQRLWRIIPVSLANDGGWNEIMRNAGFESRVDDDHYYDNGEITRNTEELTQRVLGLRLKIPKSELYVVVA